MNKNLNMRTKKNYDFTSNTRYISPFYKPRSENQGLYVKYLCDKNIPIVIGVGPAGSGKTLFACNQAVLALKSGAVDKIILTRPVVPVEEDIGFLPGSLINKMDPWTRPIFDILLEFYQQKDIDGMLHSGALEISPLAYMRGRTFKKAFVIADEMQNASPNQMLMLTTRIGDGSKLVITGDLKQSDRGVDNGLADILRKIKSYNDFNIYNNNDELGIRIVEMEGKDIQRSPIVAKLLEIYCGKPNVSHHSPSFSGNVGGVVGVSGDNVSDNVGEPDWSIGVENVVDPNEIVNINLNEPLPIVKNDVFIDNISDYEPPEIEYKTPDNDAALTPLKYTKSKHFPKDSRL
jgi:phosphate starvation-inducible PhoH-like protein